MLGKTTLALKGTGKLCYNGLDMRFRLVSSLLFALAIVLTAGCTDKTQELSMRARDEIVSVIVENDHKTPLPKETPQEPAEPKGEERSVTIVNEEEADTVSFDASLVEDADLLTLDMGYKVKVTQGNSSLLEKLPWHKSKVTLTSLIPKTLEGKQRVLSTNFSVEPKRVYEIGNRRYAEFVIENPKQDLDIHIVTKMQIFRCDLSTVKEGKIVNAGSEALDEFLKEEPFIEKSNPQIVALSKRLVGSSELTTVKNIYNFVVSSLSYDDAKAKGSDLRAIGAVAALKQKTGVCVEYADLFVALCRAQGIPAKSVGGIPTEGDNSTKGHAWVEAYIKGLGWVAFDPTWGETGAASFNSLKPAYIYLSDIRNDKTLNNSDIFGYRYVGTQVDIDYSAKIDSARARYLDQTLNGINSQKADLSQTKAQLDASFKELEAAKAELQGLKERLTELKGKLESGSVPDEAGYQGLVDEHNRLVATYNDKVSAYNRRVAAYESLRAQYEAKRKEHNAIIDKYNRIN